MTPHDSHPHGEAPDPATERLLEAFAADASRPSPRDGEFLARMRGALSDAAAAGQVVDIRPRRSRWYYAAAAAAVLVVATGLAMFLRPDPALIGNLDYHDGPFALEHPGTTDRLVAGKGASAVYALATAKRTLFVPENSTVSIESETRVKLEKGEVLVAVVPKSGDFAVETSFGTVSVIGTVFRVVVDDSAMTVYVDQGTVKVTSAGGEVAITPGTQARVSAGGAPQTSPAPAKVIPEWGWELVAKAKGLDPTCFYPSAVGPAPP